MTTTTIDRTPGPRHRAPGRPVWTPRAARIVATVAELARPPAADPYAAPRWLAPLWTAAMVGLGAVATLAAVTL